MPSPPSSRASALVDHVIEQMADFGPVQARTMFGGFGFYAQGLMFALMADGELYFKADAQSDSEFTRRDLAPFTYVARGKAMSLGYYRAPAEVFDDRGAMAWWARLAYECALRKHGAKGKADQKAKKPRKPPPPRAGRADTGAADADVPGGGALAALPNLSVKSAKMLAQAGITTPAQLASLGAVRAYVRTKAACPKATLNLLWALEGALTGRPWQEVAETDRASLLMAVEDAGRAP